MKYPFLASFLVFCVVFYLRNRFYDRKRENAKKAYFDRELRANSVRKQPLDDLDYIHIPLDSLPMDKYPDDSVISECLSDLKLLSEESIVNFTGFTNTDLKLDYGPANLPYLEKCDYNYTHLVRVLHNWGARLYELDCHNEALTVLQYAVSINTDISATYYLAADIYTERHESDKIQSLIETASGLNSLMKNSIISNLNKKLN